MNKLISKSTVESIVNNTLNDHFFMIISYINFNVFAALGNQDSFNACIAVGLLKNLQVQER